MEFDRLGHHCDYPSCHQKDYLPFNCKYCTHSFCLNHRTIYQHDCKQLDIEKKHQEELDQQIINKLHISNTNTSSSSSSSTSSSFSPSSSITSVPAFRPYRCTHVGCKRKEIFPNSCRNCGDNFCLSHRFPTQHECSAKLGRNTIRPIGSHIPSTATILNSKSCAEEAREEQGKKPQPLSSARNNTNLNQISSLLRRQQKSH